MANRFINPENYPLVSNDGSDDDITRPGGEGEGQGRKRSLDTRQAVENNAPAGAVVIMARNITIVSMRKLTCFDFDTLSVACTELSIKSRTVR